LAILARRALDQILMTNERLAHVLLAFLTQLPACGNDSVDPAGGTSAAGTSTGGTSAAGTSSTGGTSAAGPSTGGTSAAGTSTGGTSAAGSSAGTTNVAGSGGGGAGGSAGALPSGAVSTCSGAGCPYGTCNDSSTTTCSSVYPGEIGPDAPLCKGDGQYCLGIGKPSDYHSWAVSCSGTTPTATSCTGSCVYAYTDKTASCPGP
jgi:hypothetical protein